MVCLGNPRQEHFIARNIDKINAKLIFGNTPEMINLFSEKLKFPEVLNYYNYIDENSRILEIQNEDWFNVFIFIL